MTNPTAVRAARRNLVLRIERYLRQIDGGLQPESDAAVNLAVGIGALESGDYSNGEDAMLLAEMGYAPRHAPTAADLRPVAELRQVFERLRADGE